MQIPDAARKVLEAPLPATLATLDADGSPHLTAAWVGVEDDQVVIGTIPDQRKLRNIRRDPRVALSIITGAKTQWGLEEYLIVHGRAEVVEGGGSELLRRLAETYMPGADFPPPGVPDGFVTRITVEKLGGSGSWSG